MAELHSAVNSAVTLIETPLLGLIPLLPLIGAMFISTFLRADSHKQGIAGWLATLFAILSFLVAVRLFLDVQGQGAVISYKPWTWFAVERLSVDFAFRLDRLAGVMTLIVTGVGSLIHLYAIGYMEHDENRARFFCYLNLFLFSMLLLVLGDNLLVMFVGWEGVGLCSYLLIGFWFKEMPNAIAGQKAFVVNRIGDAGFLLGIFTLFIATQTFSFDGLQAAVGHMPAAVIEVAAILLFIGAVGKSAQFPLYVWLPDAMAGPTPVSALIHAATMVTAGVYMLTRLSFLYVLAPQTLLVVSVIGTFTALMAATIALSQNDIKKVLAYSTVSQLGFMFMALGAGAFSNGIFHVVTHAFFKACLFMGAGSVIIGCHHEQDMRHFGGLAKKMWATHATYLCATLAIAGFPFLSGFYSKDAILWTVFSNQGLPSKIFIAGTPLSHILWGVGAFTALLTAFYMTRSLVLTFYGSYRGHHEAHESPATVTVPLMILAVLSVCFGALWGESLIHFLAPWTRPDMLAGHEALAHNATYEFLEHLSMAIAIAGIALAFVLYLWLPAVVGKVATAFSGLHRALLNKWYVDELYAALIVRPLGAIAELLFKVFDRALIDGSVEGVAKVVAAGHVSARALHTGRISSYALVMLISLLFLTTFWLIL